MDQNTYATNSDFINIPVIVEIKVEPEDLDIEHYGRISPRAELYEDHKIKDDIVIGPEVIQQTNIPHCEEIPSEAKTPKIKVKSVCQFCNNVFASEMSRQKHIKYACTKNSNKLRREYRQEPCKLCNKVILKKNLTYHMRYYCSKSENKAKYNRKKPKQNLTCTICDKVYARSAHLKYHNIRVHGHKKSSSDNKYQCNDCGKKYLTKMTLKSHVKAKHLNLIQSAVCDFCNKTFLYKANRDRHLKKGCPMESLYNKEFICDICNQSYDKKVLLINHMKSHQETIECNFCFKKYISVIALENHIKSKHDMSPVIKNPKSTYKCNLCKQIFTTRTILNCHILYACPYNENKIPRRRFKCEFCGKDFSKRSVLESHLNQSCDLNPNKVEPQKIGCLFCPKVFYNVRNCDIHMKYFCLLNLERVIRKYSCDLCDKSYRTKHSLILHINKRHNGYNQFVEKNGVEENKQMNVE